MGAGPAGVAAGIEARRLGLDVLVVDKARFPRDKTCGDGLTTGALRLLDALGLDVRTPAVVRAGHRDRARVAHAAARSSCPCLPTATYAGVVPRVELDAALVDHARARGRRTCASTPRSPALEDDGGEYRATLDDGSVVRGAVGHRRRRPLLRRPASCSTARATDRTDLGPARRTSWHAFRQYFTGVDDRRLWVLFERGLPPRLRVGVPRRRRPRQRRLRRAPRPARRRAERASSSPRSGATLADRPQLRRRARARRASPRARVRAWPIPAAYDGARLAHGRALFVGDAAGVVDPMTGEGIAQALETGRARGARDRRVTARRRGRDAPLPRATSTARSDATSGSRRCCSTSCASRSARAARSLAAALTPWTRRNFARWMFEDYPRALVLTPDRWRRGMFTTAGGLTPYTRRMAVTDHWLSTPHWSTDIPLDTPHPRLDALAEHGYVVLRDLDTADPRVGVPRPRVHGLEERRRHQLRSRSPPPTASSTAAASGSRATSAPTRAAGFTSNAPQCPTHRRRGASRSAPTSVACA